MEKLTAGLFSKVLKDSIDEDLYKIVVDYVKHLEPAIGALTHSESIVALFDIQKIISNKTLSENTKLKRIQDVFTKYNLDFESFL